jgi:nitroreductase
MTTSISNDTLLSQLRWRYATKAFDPTKKIAPGDWAALEQALILTPTSYGFQPYRFVVVTNQAIKDQFVPHSWNQKQPSEASHFVVFAAKENVTEADVDHYMMHTAAIRGVPVESLAGFRKVLIADIVTGPRSADQHEWATRQTYIALGNFMTAAALVGIDTCPMEGIAPLRYDEILGLTGGGYRTVVACAAGYRAAHDKYALLPKVRYAADELVIHV